MHDLYLQMYEPDIYKKIKQGEKCKPTVPYEYYNRIFNTHFNLSFVSPQTDVCDSLAFQIQTEKVEIKKKQTLTNKKNVHADLKDKINLAKDDSSVETICFDY